MAMPEKPASTEPQPKVPPDGSESSGVYGGHWGDTGSAKPPGTPPPDRPQKIEPPKESPGAGDPVDPSPNG